METGETSTVELTKLGENTRKSEFKVKSESAMPRSAYSSERKTILELDVGNRNTASLVTRKLMEYSETTPKLVGFDINPQALADRYFYAWKILKDRGFPVVPTIRKVDDNHIATTNLASNGSSVYDTKLDLEGTHKPQPTDAIFTEIPVQDIGKKATNY
jgi:hypothetical protein